MPPNRSSSSGRREARHGLVDRLRETTDVLGTTRPTRCRRRLKRVVESDGAVEQTCSVAELRLGEAGCAIGLSPLVEAVAHGDVFVVGDAR